ncbi:MAG TPA: hypothetical protein VGL39_27870 [Jatrophihabitantaceae bacterium]
MKLPKLSKQQVLNAGKAVAGVFVAAFVASIIASGLDLAHIRDLAIYQKATLAGYSAVLALVGSVARSWFGGFAALRRLVPARVKLQLVDRRGRGGPLRFGKLAPRLDPRTLWFHHYAGDLPEPAAAVSWTSKLPDWLGYMLNDRLGDCTCAAVGHAIQVLTSLASTLVTVADSVILAAYEAVSGYNPVTGANDNGAVELDVLNRWRKQGFDGHSIAGYTKLDETNVTHLKQAISLFGFAYIGTAVPAAWEQAPDVWDVATGADGEIVGGHAIVFVGYDDQYLTLISWGRLYRMTWAAYHAYVDEAYAVLSPDWIKTDGTSPSGFATAALLNDLTALK